MSPTSETSTPPIDQAAFKRDLEMVADHEGVPFGRLNAYWAAEEGHLHEMRDRNAGTLMVTRAFQSLFLESVELLNISSLAASLQIELTFYTRFVPKLLHTFQQLCAAELLATHGYPLPAYTQLRNTFDHLILISAAMQGVTDFFKIEGSEPNTSLDMKEAKKLRLKTERAVREKMTGAQSGLSEETIAHLKLWDDLFDFEVHGAKLSLGAALAWVRGEEPLDVYPRYQTLPVACYSNRVCEIAWMAHRLLPLLQHSGMQFPDAWRQKWQVLDRRFEDTVRHFAEQQELKLGLAIIDLLTAKFPFTATTLYPLEGLGMPVACQP